MTLSTVSALLCAVMALTAAAGESRFYRSSSCPCGWTEYRDRCFLYVSEIMSWPMAEKNCESMRANLASVRSFDEYLAIQRLTAWNGYKNTWIGGSDAQQERLWFWIDGTPFTYGSWCSGQPDNQFGKQHCLQMNFGSKKCWDDVTCNVRLPSVCAKKILG
uniref:ladderlectin-like n=1 Tax=Semicossyphus pulcher TaxID=241346 RepID=UPI0037E8658C